MNEQKVFFPSNIKFLRERKKLSQEALAKILSFTRSKLAAIESGTTKAPQPEDFINIAEYFNISVDTLLKVDVSKLGELKLRELQAGNDVYMTGSKIRILAITVDKNERENMEYVPVKAKAGYSSGYNDPEFIAELPKFSLPNLPKGGTFRMFPTIGASMLPIPEGSDVIAQYVEDWTNLKQGMLCILILKGEQDFVFKKVEVLADNGFRLVSLNERYQPYEVDGGDIMEIWKFHSFVSREVPQPATDMMQVYGILDGMKKQLDSLTREAKG